MKNFKILLFALGLVTFSMACTENDVPYYYNHNLVVLGADGNAKLKTYVNLYYIHIKDSLSNLDSVLISKQTSGETGVIKYHNLYAGNYLALSVDSTSNTISVAKFEVNNSSNKSDTLIIRKQQ